MAIRLAVLADAFAVATLPVSCALLAALAAAISICAEIDAASIAICLAVFADAFAIAAFPVFCALLAALAAVIWISAEIEATPIAICLAGFADAFAIATYPIFCAFPIALAAVIWISAEINTIVSTFRLIAQTIPFYCLGLRRICLRITIYIIQNNRSYRYCVSLRFQRAQGNFNSSASSTCTTFGYI
jgi:hypothetical protein